MRNGPVVAMRDAKATLHEEGTSSEWRPPSASIEPPQTARGTAALSSPSAVPPLVKPGRGDFRYGEKISFEDTYLPTQVGTVVRVNQRTATVATGDGHSSRIGVASLGLGHVLDI